MDDFKFGLGDEVKCAVTGAQGRVMTLIKDIYSMNRYSIQPPYNEKRNKMPNGVTMDEATLVLIRASDMFPHKYEEGEFELGDEVKCTLFNKSGKIRDRRLHLNGCYSLSLAFLDDKGQTYTFTAQEKGVVLLNRREKVGVKKADRTTGSDMVVENLFN